MAELDALEKLVHEGFDGDGVECSSVTLGVHIFLQILIHVFEDEHELVLRVDDIVKADDILMLELLHQRDLTNGRGRRAFFRVEMDLFQRNKLPRLAIPSLEDLFLQLAYAKDDSHSQQITVGLQG
jgi:hypothetical protein